MITALGPGVKHQGDEKSSIKHVGADIKSGRTK